MTTTKKPRKAAGSALPLGGQPMTHIVGIGNEAFEHRDVMLLAVSGGWAMVRRKGAMPYVCRLSELARQP
jgi:hypothetical protein